MQAKCVGHVALYVRDLQKSLAFYRDLLGFKEIGGLFGGQAVGLTGGLSHHDVLLIQVGSAPGPLQGRRLGLYHLGIKVGDSLDELRQARDELLANKVSITGISDHVVSQSIYIRDPDGNEIELYVDADPSIWKNDPAAVLNVKPLLL